MSFDWIQFQKGVKGVMVVGWSLLFIGLGPTGTENAQTLLTKASDVQHFNRLSDPTDTTSPDHKPLSDDTLAALTVYLEARGESFAGKLAVAAVIRNRMNRKYHSDGTVKGTVLRPKQFQPWNRRKPHQVRFDLNESMMRDSMLAWKMVQDGRNVVKGAVLFYAPRLVPSPRWALQGHRVASIGGHEFYVPSKKRKQEV